MAWSKQDEFHHERSRKSVFYSFVSTSIWCFMPFHQRKKRRQTKFFMKCSQIPIATDDKKQVVKIFFVTVCSFLFIHVCARELEPKMSELLLIFQSAFLFEHLNTKRVSKLQICILKVKFIIKRKIMKSGKHWKRLNKKSSALVSL